MVTMEGTTKARVEKVVEKTMVGPDAELFNVPVDAEGLGIPEYRDVVQVREWNKKIHHTQRTNERMQSEESTLPTHTHKRACAILRRKRKKKRWND